MTAQEQSFTTQRTWQKSFPFVQRFIPQLIRSRVKQLPLIEAFLGRLQEMPSTLSPDLEFAQNGETSISASSLHGVHGNQRPIEPTYPALSYESLPSRRRFTVDRQPPESPSRTPEPGVPPQGTRHDKREFMPSGREPVWMESPSPQIGATQFQRPIVFVHHQQRNTSIGGLPSSPER